LGREEPHFRLAFAMGKVQGTPSMRSHMLAHLATTKFFFLNPLLSEVRLKRKDFPEAVRLPWAQENRFQQFLPLLLTTSVSNKSGNLLSLKS
jgi:hypothetical protein